jgi:hypothetical protein
LNSVYDFLGSKVPAKTDRLFNYKQKPLMDGKEKEPVIFPVMRESAARTLTSFPHQFLPLTVIVGDRREQEPKTPGDLFAMSASPAELRWLLRLGLPEETEILSDKVFRVAKKGYLTENYGTKNLLIVGSPAANFLARIANETAFFPFVVDPGVSEQWWKISDEIAKAAENRIKLVNYGVGPRTRELLSFYMNQYRKGGFVDPLYTFVKRGETLLHDKDYGVVTICRNPYEVTSSGQFVAIMAAGVHLPGTMHGLALLSQPRTEFQERPLGGVFNVELTQIDWVRRLSDAKVNWSTEPYDLKMMREALASLKAPEKLQQIQIIIAESNIDDRIDLLNQLSEKGLFSPTL